MHPTAIGLSVLIGILVSGGIAGHFNRYTDEDWKAFRDGIKTGLTGFKDWALTHGILGWIVYVGACWVLVVVVVVIIEGLY